MRKEYIDRMSDAAKSTYHNPRYTFALTQDGRMRCHANRNADAPGLQKLIKERMAVLAEIKAALLADREADKAERKAIADRRAAIPGIKAIEDARTAWAEYRIAFDRAMDTGAARFPAVPEADPDELAKQYPEAAALLTAEAWALAEHDVKSSAGRKAVKAILQDGADPIKAVDEMDKTFGDYCRAHMWD